MTGPSGRDAGGAGSRSSVYGFGGLLSRRMRSPGRAECERCVSGGGGDKGRPSPPALSPARGSRGDGRQRRVSLRMRHSLARGRGGSDASSGFRRAQNPLPNTGEGGPAKPDRVRAGGEGGPGAARLHQQCSASGAGRRHARHSPLTCRIMPMCGGGARGQARRSATSSAQVQPPPSPSGSAVWGQVLASRWLCCPGRGYRCRRTFGAGPPARTALTPAAAPTVPTVRA